MPESGHLELARSNSSENWDKERLCPSIAPGSQEEALALARIDELRDEDLGGQMRGHPDTAGAAYRSTRARAELARRRARARSHWRRHAGQASGGTRVPSL